jgi:hypothetical protein
MITSSMPSPPMTDQPSSLKPLIASLNPLKGHNKNDVKINNRPKKYTSKRGRIVRQY